MTPTSPPRADAAAATLLPGRYRDRCLLRRRGPCSGALVRAHLIPQQVIRRELRGTLFLDGIVWDPRAWAPICGGAVGLSGHHGQLDSGALRVARGDLPTALEAFADEFGLGWWLDRRYGPLG